jgi:mercuric ion binding protein
MKKHFLFAAVSSLLFVFNTCLANTSIRNQIKGGVNDTLTVSFKVNGNSSCKSTIEQALTSQTGVLSASWDVSAKQITVKFLPAKVQQSDLYTFLAAAGYDNAELRAKKGVYDALSTDCKYTRDPDNE